MVTIIEEIDPIPYAKQAPIAGHGDVPAYVLASARRPYTIGVQECNKGNYEAALEQFDQALQLDRNFPHAWYNKGTVLGNLGQYRQAVEALEQALRLMPEFIDALYNKGVALARVGRAKEALEIFEQTLIQSPNDPQVWLGKSIVLLGLGETKGAIETLQEAIRHVDDEPAIWSITGVAHARSGEFGEAQKAFEKAFAYKNGPSAMDTVSYKAWANSIVSLGISALLGGNVTDFEAAGFAYIDVLEKAQKEGAGAAVEDVLLQIKSMLQQKKRKARQALAAFEELEVFINLMKIKDPFEGWRALGKVISESWPKGVSAVQAIREQRR